MTETSQRNRNRNSTASSAFVNESFPINRILVPIDGSSNSMRALDAACEIARKYGSELILLHVMPTPRMFVEFPISSGTEAEYYQYAEGEANQIVDTALKTVVGVAKARGRVVRASESVVGEIIDVAAEDKVDLVVIGTRGMGGFKRLLLGSVSSGVISHAHCNVLVVR